MIKIYRIMLCVTGIFLCSFLVGCAETVNYKSMIVKPTSTEQRNPKLMGAIAVGSVTGGKKTYALWIPEIDNKGVRKALDDSLSAYGYSADSYDTAKYTLDADLQQLNRPFIGLNVEAESIIVYRIYGSGIDKKYKIRGMGKASVSDAFVGNTRVKLANERSIQDNIREFLKQLKSSN